MLSKLSGSILAFAVLAGCTHRQAPGPSASVAPTPALTIAAVAGDYALVSLDGHALPYAASGRTLTSGSFALNANGTFRLQTVYGPSGGAGTSAAFSGACYPEGDQLKMVWDEGGLANLSFRGDTVFVKRDGALYAYLRSR